MSNVEAGLRELRAFFQKDSYHRLVGQIMWLSGLAMFVLGVIVGALLGVALHG